MKPPENNHCVEFVHPELMAPITAIGGNYTFYKSERFCLGEDDILYLVGAAVLDSTCCGYGGCAYAFVPGIVRQWHVRQSQDGKPVSLVTPIADPGMREMIKQRIMKKEIVQQVNFG